MFSIPESISVFTVLSTQPLASSTSIWMELVSESLLCGAGLLYSLLFELEGISIGLLGTWKVWNFASLLLSFCSANDSDSSLLAFSSFCTLKAKGLWFLILLFSGDCDIGVIGGEIEFEGELFSKAANRANLLLLI